MLESSPNAMVTVKRDKCRQGETQDYRRSRDFEGRRRPSNRPVPMDPPTATIAIWPAPS